MFSRGEHRLPSCTVELGELRNDPGWALKNSSLDLMVGSSRAKCADVLKLTCGLAAHLSDKVPGARQKISEHQ